LEGRLDLGFGAGGKQTTDFLGGNDQTSKITVDSDGQVLVAGAVTDANFSQDLALIRYLFTPSVVRGHYQSAAA